MQTLSLKEIRLLELAEGDLPLTPRPFDVWARELDLSIDEVLGLLEGLRLRGVIRDLRAILRHQQAGISSNAMLALCVSANLIEQAGAQVASREWVTHCYERPGFAPFTLFAMVHARSEAELGARVRELTAAAGATEYRVLKSLKEFKKSSMKYASYYRRRGHE